VRTGEKGLPMSKRLAFRAPVRKAADLSDLFSWRSTVIHPYTSRAGQYVMRRYHVSRHTAEVIAALAGLGGEDR
jgi:hypothetical protein